MAKEHNAEYELGRYKKKVADQADVIAKLEAEIAGYSELLQANNAIVAAVVKACGEIVIAQEDIKDALVAKLDVQTMYDQESRSYTLRTVVKKDGGEDTC